MDRRAFLKTLAFATGALALPAAAHALAQARGAAAFARPALPKLVAVGESGRRLLKSLAPRSMPSAGVILVESRGCGGLRPIADFLLPPQVRVLDFPPANGELRLQEYVAWFERWFDLEFAREELVFVVGSPSEMAGSELVPAIARSALAAGATVRCLHLTGWER